MRRPCGRTNPINVDHLLAYKSLSLHGLCHSNHLTSFPRREQQAIHGRRRTIRDCSRRLPTYLRIEHLSRVRRYGPPELTRHSCSLLPVHSRSSECEAQLRLAVTYDHGPYVSMGPARPGVQYSGAGAMRPRNAELQGQGFRNFLPCPRLNCPYTYCRAPQSRSTNIAPHDDDVFCLL